MEFRLDGMYFEMIKNRDKKVEIRLNDEKRQQLKIGDELIFVRRGDDKQRIKTKVTALRHYKSFKEMVMFEPKNDIGFAFKTLDEIIETYEGFYSKEEEEKYGVLAIKFKIIKEKTN